MVPSFKAEGAEESTLELNSEARVNMESQLSFFLMPFLFCWSLISTGARISQGQACSFDFLLKQN